MRSCVYCDNRYEKGSGVSFHRFPTDYKLKAWLRNMNLSDWTPKKSDHLCSKHFSEDCFHRHRSRTTLIVGSVPTIFLEAVKSEIQARENFRPEAVKSEIQDSEMESQDPLFFHATPNDICQLSIVKSERVSPPTTPTTSTKRIDVTTSTRQYRTPKIYRTVAEIRASIKQDHQYEITAECSRQELQRLKKALKKSRQTCKSLTMKVKRLKNIISRLKTVIGNQKTITNKTEISNKCL